MKSIPIKHQFINWGKNINCEAQHYYQPSSEEEIMEIVKSHDKIRMVGSGHSWSALCQTEGVLMNLDRYDKIISIDRRTLQVRAQAGIKMWQLNEQLAAFGLALENQGSIDQQAIAGAVSTGTHGSGINFQILGSQLLEITLIKADGSKQIIHKEKDAELFRACVVNLGAMGVISEVVIQAVDAFNLHDYTTTIPFEALVENLDFFLENSDHFKVWWLPPTDEVVIYSYNRTQKKRTDSRMRRYLKDEVFSVAVYRSLVWGTKNFPKAGKGINRFLTSQMRGPLERIEESSKVFIVPEPPFHLETEWAFDVQNAQDILLDYRKWIADNDYCLSFIQEIRFTKADNFWLSGCYKRDSIWIGLYAYNHENWEEKLASFETFATRHNGRPHWGKLFNVQRDYLEKQYPKYQDFVDLRAKFDPEGKFVNDYIQNLFV